MDGWMDGWMDGRTDPCDERTNKQVELLLQGLVARGAPVSVVVRALCAVYNNVVDRLYLYRAVTGCHDQLRREIVHRLGLLNVWSPAQTGTPTAAVDV
jgi:hypothetical protein